MVRLHLCLLFSVVRSAKRTVPLAFHHHNNLPLLHSQQTHQQTHQHQHQHQHGRVLVPTALCSTNPSSSSGGEQESLNQEDASLFASLNKRREELRAESDTYSERWREAKFQSTIRLAIENDWIRRLDVGKWPLVALGSASGSIHVADLQYGNIVASASEVHEGSGGDEEAIRLMHGDYDGSGVLAIAISTDYNLVVSAGREGSAKVWRINEDDSDGGIDLLPLGELSALPRGVLVTSIAFDDLEGMLWIGCFDGTVHRFHCDSIIGTADIPQQPLSVNVNSPVLSVAIAEEIGLVACATSSGSVELLSADFGTPLTSWNPFDDDGSTTTCARSVAIVRANGNSDDSNSPIWSLVCGGSDGTIHVRSLATDALTGAAILETTPYEGGAQDESSSWELQPSHSATVVSLAGREGADGGLLISAALDGTLRVWDLATAAAADGNKDAPPCLYCLAGYKVWLGSVCTDEDGLRLISDGCDNTVLVHDFSEEIVDDMEG